MLRLSSYKNANTMNNGALKINANEDRAKLA